MHNTGGKSLDFAGDAPDVAASDRLVWYCNEILKCTDGSGAISAIEFNREGTHLAYGNADGIVSVVEIGQAEESEITHTRHACSRLYQSFLSHEPEFDCLKSQAIEEKINLIRWLPHSGHSHFLLTSNERTIKLWRLAEVPLQSISNMNFPTEIGCRRKVVIRTASDIKVPVCTSDRENMAVRASNKKVFARGHGFSITGLSPSINRETFFSADPLRINMWHLDVTTEVFSIIDRIPDRLDERTPLVTGLSCSNVSPSLFAYGTNWGSVFVCDTRCGALCDRPSLSFHSISPDESSPLTIFINSISDLKFGQSSDQYLFTRDYITAKVWDSRMSSQPAEIYPVQTHLQSHLGALYESELIFDDFKLSVSSNDQYIITGSYNKIVKVFDRHAGEKNEYRLVMQDEEATPFLDPFRDNEGQPMFITSMADSADLPWPRRIMEYPNVADNLSDEAFVKFLNAQMLNLSNGPKWLQVSWRPNSMVAAVSHSNGMHLLEALC